MEESRLHGVLRLYLEEKDRGAAQEICVNTELTAPELSNWLAGRRDIPAHKLIAVISWLLGQQKITITIH